MAVAKEADKLSTLEQYAFRSFSVALESIPSTSAFNIAKKLSSRRFSEYGMNNHSYNNLINIVPKFQETDTKNVLNRELEKPIDVLDLSNWQIDALKSINIFCIKNILEVTENHLKTAHYVGEKRARRVRSAALASVYEYLNG